MKLIIRLSIKIHITKLNDDQTALAVDSDNNGKRVSPVVFAFILFWRAALLKVPIKLYMQGRKHMWLVYWRVYNVQRKVHSLPPNPDRNDLRDLLRMLLFRDWHSSRMHGLYGGTWNVLILVFGQVHSKRWLLRSRLQGFLRLMQNRLLRSQQSLL